MPHAFPPKTPPMWPADVPILSADPD